MDTLLHMGIKGEIIIWQPPPQMDDWTHDLWVPLYMKTFKKNSSLFLPLLGYSVDSKFFHTLEHYGL